MKYIDGMDVKPVEGCIFCDKPREAADDRNFIVHRGERGYLILNIFPYNNGHIMAVPYLHTSRLAELDADTRLELFDLAGLAVEAMTRTMRPDGFNMGMNIGRSAGAGIADHLHMHIVPRWNGDTNFMPVIGSTKVISEALEDTYHKLKTAVGAVVNEQTARN